MISKQLSRYLFICSIILLITIVFLSCNNTKRDLLINRWKIETILIPGQKEMMDKMDSAQKASVDAELKQMIDNTIFEFRKDSTFLFDLGYTKAEGKFNLSADEKKIVTQLNDEKRSESVAIESLSKDKLIIKQKDNSGKEIVMTLIPSTKK